MILRACRFSGWDLPLLLRLEQLVISSEYYTMMLKSYVLSDAIEESLERDTDRDLGVLEPRGDLERVLTTPDDDA